MKNVHEVLLQKQNELASTKRDLEALRVVVPLLREWGDAMGEVAVPTRTIVMMLPKAVQSEAAIDHLLVPSPPEAASEKQRNLLPRWHSSKDIPAAGEGGEERRLHEYSDEPRTNG